MYEEAWCSHHCFVKLSGWFASPPIYSIGALFCKACVLGDLFYKDLLYNDLFYKDLFYRDLFLKDLFFKGSQECLFYKDLFYKYSSIKIVLYGIS